ncbi:ankyrin repeat domain-containing protein [Candidatus Dependentiae bacterium]|nr:MAG: ankyrin repeat domain-containing protein [Candidatus Dependentiae bacterium]
MNMKKLVLLSFRIKFLIAAFFVGLLCVHYLLCQALFQRTASLGAVRTELQKGANVNARTKSVYDELNGLTPLIQAATWGDLDRVKLLLEYKADVNLRAKNKRGDTALHMAIRNSPYGDFNKVLQIIQLLLDNKANVNAKNNYGDTPLHATLDAYQEDIQDRVQKIVRLIIERGAEINAQNDNGNTHLHLAVFRGYGTWIEWFLKKYGTRINLDLVNKKHYTIESLANRLGNTDVIEAIKKGLPYTKK